VILSACGGFLLAVLWMDLMFDVQVFRHREAELPEPVLRSIAAYYRRVTSTARPMGHLVAAVMLVAIVALVAEIVGDPGRRWLALASLLSGGGAIGLGIGRAFPDAVRLGAREGTAAEQSALARSICRDHLVCLAGIVAFLALQAAAPLLVRVP
jgi:hypothetical protein